MTNDEIKLHQVWNNLIQELQRNRVNIRVSNGLLGAKISLVDLDSGTEIDWHEGILSDETKEMGRGIHGND